VQLKIEFILAADEVAAGLKSCCVFICISFLISSLYEINKMNAEREG
jgi:hypothetical protein